MIKRNNMKLTAMSLIVGMALMTGCNTQTDVEVDTPIQSEVSTIVTDQIGTQVTYEDDDYYTDWSKDTVTKITLGSAIEVSGVGAQVEGSIVTITDGGTYVLSGSLEDGQIVVDLLEKDTVRLVLNGVQITYSNGPVINVKNAGKAVISLEEGMENTLVDGESYVLEEGSDEPNGTLFSKDDLVINGTGTLNIQANYQDAIVSKDSLKIVEGNIVVDAVDDGIRGKDMVAIKDGNITITSGGEGIKATNTEDTTLGFVYIENGTFNMTTKSDGIQAETDLGIIDGTFNITTGGGSANGVSHAQQFMMPSGNMGGNRPNRGEMTAPSDAGTVAPPDAGMTKPSDEGMTAPSDAGTVAPPDAGMTKPSDEGMTAPSDAGTIAPPDAGMKRPSNEGMTVPSDEGGVAPQDAGMIAPSDMATTETTDAETTVSTKALKAGDMIMINGGTFNIDSAEDAVHSNNSVVINGGQFSIAAGDDGIHGDLELTINGGSIDITKSYEGLEAETINIENGEISLVASDDGINAAEASATEDMATGDLMNAQGTAVLNVNGGWIYVDASGDGLDANGTITINDGTVIVDGPTNGGNGSLDYDKACDVNGGTLIAAGSLGMAQSTSQTSTQKEVNVTFTTTQEAGQTVAILDEEGKAVVSFTAKKAFQTVSMVSDLLESGKTYTFSYGGTISGESKNGLATDVQYTDGTIVTDFVIEDAITYLNESGVTTAPRGGMMGGHGNFRNHSMQERKTHTSKTEDEEASISATA